MKLKLLTLALFFYTIGNAQLPTGSIAPDFTVVDIEGNQHHLYELLDEGKTVVVDFFGTWCDACWNHHQEEVLHELWELNGPDGTDDYFVMMIETDGATTNADLYGTGTNTEGNWVEGVPFPIIEDASLNALFNLTYYPSIYMICPNRVIKLMGQPDDVGVYYDASQSCLSFGGVNNAGIVSTPSFLSDACGEATYTPSVIIQNVGAEVITTATLDLSVNGNIEETINWEGNLASYDLAEIQFTSALSFEEIELEISINSVNGVADDQPGDNVYTETLIASPTANPGMMTLELMTDEYGHENYWAIIDDTGTILIDGGNETVGLSNFGSGIIPADPNAYEPDTLYTIQFEVPQTGCLSFVLTDYFGDGLCCGYGEGYYRLSDADGKVLAEGAELENRIDHYFINGQLTSGAEELLTEGSFSVNPTLVSHNLTIDFNLVTKSEIKIVVNDLMGNEVLYHDLGIINIGNYQNQFNIKQLTNGIYFVNLHTDKGLMTQRIVKM